MKTIELQDGDIITATSEDFPLLVEHQGIVSYDGLGRCFIYHTVPGKDLEKDTVAAFFSRRKFKNLTRTKVPARQIEKRVSALGSREYNLISFNCYDFINFVISPEHA